MTEGREAWERKPLADQVHASYLIPLLESGASNGTVFPGTQTVSSRRYIVHSFRRNVQCFCHAVSLPHS
jgi:hypothetical protein